MENTKKTIGLSHSGATMLRTVMASYFIALSLGVIQSTDITLLPKLVLGANQANFLANTLVIILAYMVLMGTWLRPAALILGSYFLASSAYVTFQSLTPDAMSNFWRDIALFTGLMLTYFQASSTPEQTTDTDAAERRKFVEEIEMIVRPRRVATPNVATRVKRIHVPIIAKIENDKEEVVNIFAA